MVVQIPEQGELRARIAAHLDARPGNPLVAAAWGGYLAALGEWGVLDPYSCGRIAKLLPDDGLEEITEILGGPDYREVQRQLDEEQAAIDAQRPYGQSTP